MHLQALMPTKKSEKNTGEGFFNLSTQEGNWYDISLVEYTIFYNEDDLNALNRCFDYLHKIIDSLLNTLGYKNSMFRSDVFDTCSMYLYQKFCEKAYIPHMVAFRSMVKVSIYNAISKRLKYAKETRRNIQDYYYMRYRDIKYKRSFSYSEANKEIQKVNKVLKKQFAKDCKLRFPENPVYVSLCQKMFNDLLNQKGIYRRKGGRYETLLKLAVICKTDLKLYLRQLTNSEKLSWVKSLYGDCEYSSEEFSHLIDSPHIQHAC